MLTTQLYSPRLESPESCLPSPSLTSSASTLSGGAKQLHKSHTLKKPTCKGEVEEAMAEMDQINSTQFRTWIRSESHISFLLSTKGPLILSYIAEDPVSAMYSLEWLTEGWTAETVAELVLKLFYGLGISSKTFCERVYGICSEWSVEKVGELFPILLVGESVSVISTFLANWAIASQWNVDYMANLTTPILSAFRYTPDNYSGFLLETVFLLLEEPVIHDEIEMMVMNDGVMEITFEMLYQIVLEQWETRTLGSLSVI